MPDGHGTVVKVPSTEFDALVDVAKRHFRLFMEMLGAKVGAEEGSARGYAGSSTSRAV